MPRDTSGSAATLADVLAVVEARWPLRGAESWDASGLLLGDPTQPVTRIHLAVDAVPAVADEAVAVGAQLLLVHHPLMLRGVSALPETTVKGRVVGTLVRGGCALVATHTNGDVVETGTSAVLASALGLRAARPIEASAHQPSGADSRGIGRVGDLPRPTTLGRLARHLADVLPPTAGGIRVAGEYDREVRRIALCAGAGDSLLGHPAVAGADVYVTSDLRHHPASDAIEQSRLAGGPALIDISHWAAEWLWLETAAAELRADLPHVEITVSELRTDPWDFAVVV